MSEAAERDRFRIGLLGLAAGDALGTTLEFESPGTFEPIDDMVERWAVPFAARSMGLRHLLQTVIAFGGLIVLLLGLLELV